MKGDKLHLALDKMLMKAGKPYSCTEEKSQGVDF
jgi:hypothetical protein